MKRITHFEDGKWVLQDGTMTTRAHDVEELAQRGIDRLAYYEELDLEPEEIQQTLENYSSFLCEVTGNRMSKTNYTVNAMVTEVHDYFERACDECYEKKETARYKYLEEQGRLVELPCAIGDMVYLVQRRMDGTDCVRNAEFWWTDIPQLNKTVFLSREEAESALAQERR